MIHRIIDIKTDGLEVFDREQRRLVICLEYCSMTIALVNRQSGQWVAVEVLQCAEEDTEDMAELLIQLKQQSALINYTSLETRLFLRTPNCMMVPVEFIDDAKSFLDWQFGMKGRDLVVTEQVNHEMFAALKTRQEWVQPFTSLFPQASRHASLGWLVKQTLEASHREAGPTMWIQFTPNLLEFVIAADGELLLARCFLFNAIEDMSYHLLNACRQLHLSPGQVCLHIQGLIDPGTPLSDTLQKYFGEVQFANGPLQDWGTQFKSVPPHYFTGLINASL